MRGRVRIDLAAVAGARDDRAVAHDGRADRDIAMLRSPTRLFQSLVHEALVIGRPRDGAGVAENRLLSEWTVDTC